MHFKWRTSNRIKSSRLIPSVEQTLARRVSEENQHCAALQEQTDQQVSAEKVK